MKTAQFNALCNREHEQDRGVVVRLYLTEDSYAELVADVLGGGEVAIADGRPLPGGPVGAKLDTMVNPVTRTPVSIGRAIAKALLADTAEVTRWVTVDPAQSALLT